jgi:hypothetical protein
VVTRCCASQKNGAGREARPALVSILTGKHDRQHADGLCGVARVFAPHVAPGAEAGPVVIVDLPESLVAVMLERSKVVFAIRARSNGTSGWYA